MERIRRQELFNQRNREQEEIVKLKSKKKSLQLELEALVGIPGPVIVTHVV